MDQIMKSARLEKAELNDEELALINAQTLRPMTAEEVFTFRLAACDNQVDRDFERFTEATLAEMAERFAGCPVLRDHKWSADAQTARVYAGSVEPSTGGGVQRLVLRCYMIVQTRHLQLSPRHRGRHPAGVFRWAGGAEGTVLHLWRQPEGDSMSAYSRPGV